MIPTAYDPKWSVTAYLHEGGTDDAEYGDEDVARQEVISCRKVTALYQRVSLKCRPTPWGVWEEVAV